MDKAIYTVGQAGEILGVKPVTIHFHIQARHVFPIKKIEDGREKYLLTARQIEYLERNFLRRK
ncbi:MAG: hypothetical protein WBC74_04545 [Candidatus Omnitrophota bacterium]